MQSLSLPEHSVTRLDTVHCADALAWLRGAPSDWLNCAITSPPYFAVRDYGIDGQVGLEETPDAYVAQLVDVFRELRRVLRPDGCFWLNLGDSYWRDPKRGNQEVGGHAGLHTGRTAAAGMQHKHCDLPEKNLLGIPWRVALALQADGWILRAAAPWVKRSALPESVQDRPSSALEYVFLFVKSPRYWYDNTAIRQAASPASLARIAQSTFDQQTGGEKDYGHGPNGNRSARRTLENFAANPGRNRRNTDWYFDALSDEITALQALQEQGGVRLDDGGLPLAFDITADPSPLPHFAMMPRRLVTPMLLASCPAQVCAKCGAPYERVVERERVKVSDSPRYSGVSMRNDADDARFTHVSTTLGWRATCDCHADTRAGICLDMFAGTGTTLLEAQKHHRHYIGVDLNPDTVELARRRLQYRGDDRRMVREQEAGVQQISLFDGVGT